MKDRIALTKLLESLQKKSLVELGNDPLTSNIESDEAILELATLQGYGDDEKIKANIKASKLYIEDLIKLYPPSKYQDYSQYTIILYVYKQLLQYSDNLEVKLPPLPVIGTLPMSEVNATVFTLPNVKDYLIILQEGVIQFADCFSKVIAYCFNYEEITGVGPVINVKNIDDEIDENSIAYIYFENLIDNYIFNGNIKATLRHDRFIGEGVANSLRNFSEMFVLSHEMGHIIKNHLGDKVNEVWLSSSEQLEKISYSHNLEYEADEVALELMLINEIRQPSGPLYSTAGCQIILEGFDIIYKTINLVKKGNINNVEYPDSHPAPMLRKERILRKANEILINKKARPEFIKSVSAFSEQITLAVQQLWKIYENNFHKKQKNKIATSKIWNIDLSGKTINSWSGFTNSSFQTIETIASGLFSNDFFRRSFFSSLLYKQTDVQFLLLHSLISNISNKNSDIKDYCEKNLLKINKVSKIDIEELRKIIESRDGNKDNLENPFYTKFIVEANIKLSQICTKNLDALTESEYESFMVKVKHKGKRSINVTELLGDSIYEKEIVKINPKYLEITSEYIMCKLSPRPQSKELIEILKGLDDYQMYLYDKLALYYIICINLYLTDNQHDDKVFRWMFNLSPEEIILDLMTGSIINIELISSVASSCLEIINYNYPLNDINLNTYIQKKMFNERVFLKFYLWNVSLLVNRALKVNKETEIYWKDYLDI
ncbi:M48 family metalloprotease [Spirosoma horti]